MAAEKRIVLDFKIRMRTSRPCDEWTGVAVDCLKGNLSHRAGLKFG